MCFVASSFTRHLLLFVVDDIVRALNNRLVFPNSFRVTQGHSTAWIFAGSFSLDSWHKWVLWRCKNIYRYLRSLDFEELFLFWHSVFLCTIVCIAASVLCQGCHWSVWDWRRQGGWFGTSIFCLLFIYENLFKCVFGVILLVDNQAERAVSLLFLPLLLGALMSSISSGIISDRFGGRCVFFISFVPRCCPGTQEYWIQTPRPSLISCGNDVGVQLESRLYRFALWDRRKFLVYFAGCLMCIACLFFAFTRSFSFDIFLGFLFGLGYGCFSAIDWAMVRPVGLCWFVLVVDCPHRPFHDRSVLLTTWLSRLRTCCPQLTNLPRTWGFGHWPWCYHRWWPPP